MRIDLFFTIPEVDPQAVQGSTALVIDIIRATSVIAEALANGARAVYPVSDTEEALRLANQLGRETTLLCGERRGLKIDGFDLGNSPREFTRERVAGRSLVMTTTNGTRAFLAAAEADRVVAASLLNLGAAARRAAEAQRVSILCAGRSDRFSLDDALCGGLLVRALLDAWGGDVRLNDGARAAAELARGLDCTVDTLAGTAAGRAVVDIGLGDDLPFLAQRDRHDLAPEMQDRVIRLPT
ncbi:MAG: 2-phosphosulfolactate phosphatase [Gemmatimonadota bacterium]|nr:2-phosphosulfolactate phosphatase [Gemmatimonadota bacterium]